MAVDISYSTDPSGLLGSDARQFRLHIVNMYAAGSIATDAEGMLYCLDIGEQISFSGCLAWSAIWMKWTILKYGRRQGMQHGV